MAAANSGRDRRLRACAALVLASCAVLPGCPLPLPSGWVHGSRQNVGEGVPGFIVPGTTTRADVLLRLGAADGRALDDHWLSFGADYGVGGVVFLVGRGGLGVERTESRRLVVYFDERGVVERTSFERRACSHMIPGDEVPCLDRAGRDLPMLRKRPLPAASGAGG